jgi:glycosyltransferase involved in cell wall biosynthesis
MRIGVDVSSVTAARSGVGNYAYSLVKHLGKLDAANEYVLFCNSFSNQEKCQLLNFNRTNVRVINPRIPNDLLKPLWWYLRFPPIDLLIGRVDLFHSTGEMPPPCWKSRCIDTIHDVTPLRFPEFHTAQNLLASQRKYARAAKKADLVLTNSENSRQDIIKYLGIAPERVRAIYLGVEPEFQPIREKTRIEPVLQKYGIKGPYILFVGNLEPRKNLIRLIEAYDWLRRTHSVSHKLVLCGGKGWLYEDIFQRARRSPFSEDIVFTGYAPAGELPVLMSAADVFVYVSLYEGFGLPVLEAMACATPVIASNVSSLPEVVADAGLLVDPQDAPGLSEKMYEVLTEDGLRTQLIRKGMERARLFSWERCARETLEVYNKM